MTTIARGLNNAYSQSPAEKTKINILRFKIGPVFNIVMLSLILFILVFYLIEINQIVTLGFRVDELEKNKEELKNTNKDLEIQKIQMESSANRVNELSILNFVKINKIEYVKPVAGLALTKK